MPNPLRAALAVTATAALIAPAYSAPIKIGSTAPAIKVSKWVKGTPVAKFAPGKVYVVEFWATWCGPCKESIPHLTAMAKKLQGKATFIGVSISEDDPNYQAKVAKFVKAMGPKMDYNVAVDDAPMNGSMSRNWMEAAGQNGIPTAFIVDRKGKIAWIGHPMEMEEPLARVIAGTFDPAAEAKRQEAAMAEQEKQAAAIRKIQARMGEFQKLLKTDEPAAMKIAAEIGEGDGKDIPGLLNFLAWTIVDDKTGLKTPDLDLAERLARRAVELTESKEPSILDTLSYALFKKGNVAEAITIQEKAVALIPENAPADLKKEITDRLTLYKSKK